MKKYGKLKLIGSVSLLIVILDQLTKYLVSKNITQSITLLPFLKISYVQNTGVAFGLFKGFQWLSVLFALIVIGIVIHYSDKILKKDKFLQVSIALMLGGAIGNLIDRLFLGYVIDFIDIVFWPAFNIADSAISIGAVLLIIHLLIKEKH